MGHNFKMKQWVRDLIYGIVLDDHAGHSGNLPDCPLPQSKVSKGMYSSVQPSHCGYYFGNGTLSLPFGQAWLPVVECTICVRTDHILQL